MLSPSGNSSGSISSLQNPEMDDQRKRKRMISNRESARRSRMRKKKHLDELMEQVSQLRAQNSQLMTNTSVVSQLTLNIESENSVLMAQMSELNSRLQALNDIITCMNTSSRSVAVAATTGFESTDCYNYDDYDQMIGGSGDDFLNSWGLSHVNQPIMASADAFMY